VPKLTASKEEIKGLPVMHEGMVTVRLDGFKPTWSKDKGSVNLNPQLKVINHPEYNDRQVFDNLNTKAKWIWKDFCHAFGVPVLEASDGSVEFPGDFQGPDDNPEAWQYVGPLLGQVGQLYLIQSSYNGNDNNKIKYYVCKLGSACHEKHSQNLAK
jgi:hypothetical protein